MNAKPAKMEPYAHQTSIFFFSRETKGDLHIVWLYFDVINGNINQSTKNILLVKYI